MIKVGLARLRFLVAPVRPMGWVLVCLLVGSGALAWLTSWREMVVLSLACGELLVLASPSLLGRTRVVAELRLEPERVSAGESVVAGVMVKNIATRGLLPTTLEVPVGTATHRFALGRLAAGASHEESFTIRTERRGVIEVGPAITRRGDPLGIFSRDVEWTPRHEVLVRPSLVPLATLGAGLLRDLEGVSTNAVSQNDLAFHALREYVPGDDLRHIHWRSSAKVMASSGESSLLVRQYLDTRRTQALIVADDRAAAWRDPEDFESAMSVAASIIVRALLDEFEISFVCGARSSTDTAGHAALDAVCRAEFGEMGLVEAARRAAAVAPETSLVFLLGGAETALNDLLVAAAAFPVEVRRFAILIEPDGTSHLREADGLPVLHLAAKEDLGALLSWRVGR